MIILDTDNLTIIQRGTEPEYTRLKEYLKRYAEKEVYTTVINFEEQMRGWLSVVASARDSNREIKAYKDLQLSLKFFQDVQILEYDQAAKDEFTKLQKLRIRIGTMDLKIAAIAIARNAQLLSRNLKDFQKVADLMVKDATEETLIS